MVSTCLNFSQLFLNFSQLFKPNTHWFHAGCSTMGRPQNNQRDHANPSPPHVLHWFCRAPCTAMALQELIRSEELPNSPAWAARVIPLVLLTSWTQAVGLATCLAQAWGSWSVSSELLGPHGGTDVAGTCRSSHSIKQLGLAVEHVPALQCFMLACAQHGA